MIRGSIVVSISACHAEDPGSIPGRGDYCLLLGAAAREHVAPCAIFSIRLHAADWGPESELAAGGSLTEAETEFCRGGLSAGTVVWGRPHQPQQPCLPGSAESAADIKLSWWRGVLGQQGLNTPVVAQWSTHPPARWKTGARTPAIANTASCPRQHAEDYCNFQKRFHIRGSIVVSISACHAEDPGSIPGRGG